MSWRTARPGLQQTPSILGKGGFVVSIVDRCAAAHAEDARGCEGSREAVRIVDLTGGETTGCVLHGAVLLASLVEARVYPGSGDPGGAAIEVYQRAQSLEPFDFLRGAKVRQGSTPVDGNEAARDRYLSYRVQRRAADLLTDLLMEAGGAGLPQLVWTVGQSGTLTGRVCCGTDAERRASFQRWMQIRCGETTLGQQRGMDGDAACPPRELSRGAGAAVRRTQHGRERRG